MKQTIWLLALLGSALGIRAMAQEKKETDVYRIENWEKPGLDENGKLESLIKGTVAIIPIDKPDVILIENLHLIQYDEDGEVSLTVKTPKCSLNQVTRRASSDEAVQIERENMQVTGKGFEFDSRKSVMKIKSKARTVLRRPKGEASQFSTGTSAAEPIDPPPISQPNLAEPVPPPPLPPRKVQP